MLILVRIFVLSGTVRGTVAGRWAKRAGSTLRTSQAMPQRNALEGRNALGRNALVTIVLQEVHRSHFGSRYRMGCCDHAGLFEGVQFPALGFFFFRRFDAFGSPDSASQKSWQHPKDFPGGPPP